VTNPLADSSGNVMSTRKDVRSEAERAEARVDVLRMMQEDTITILTSRHVYIKRQF